MAFLDVGFVACLPGLARAEAFAEVCTGEFGALWAGLDILKGISGASTMLF